MTKPTTTPNDTTTVGAQLIAPEDFDTAGNGWRECSLGEIAQINPTEKLVKGSIAKKIDMAALQPFTKKPQYVLTEPFNGGMKFKNGDTVIARITPCLENGKTAYIDIFHDKEVGFGSTEYIVLREKDGLSDKEFLYYFATSSVFRDVAILSMTGSSGRQRVQTDVVTNHVFEIPPLPEQKAIAAVLSSLDDKIDLLHRQNQTLEAMAQTLFRQWFIEDAREDWVEMAIFDIAKHIKVGVQPSKLPTIEFSHYSLPAFDAGKQPILELGQAILSNKYAVLDKTILVSKLNPRVPRVWGVHKAPSNSICSTEFQVIKPNNTDYFEFLYFFLCSSNATDELSMSASGTSGSHQRVSPEDIMNLTFFTEGLEMIKEFSLLVSASLVKIQSNIDSIQTLTQLRDTLLPKLMSGEVRVV